MSTALAVEQLLNGLQLSVILFLMAAGLTLVFGVMSLINLAHGSFYMLGGYLAVSVQEATGSFLVAVLLALPIVALVGMIIELIVLRRLYARDHLAQVLATFGLILFLNELVRMVWGPAAYSLDVPAALQGTVEVVPSLPFPAFRLAILATGLLVALLLFWLIGRTRLGMLIRAGAGNREMVGALGADVRLLYMLVFGLGAALAALAGALAGPTLAVQVGMGETILILTFVVIVIGGIGSVHGALLGALLVGIVDTFGRALLPPAIAEMAIYLLMAAVLFVRPRGLFPADA